MISIPQTKGHACLIVGARALISIKKIKLRWFTAWWSGRRELLPPPPHENAPPSNVSSPRFSPAPPFCTAPAASGKRITTQKCHISAVLSSKVNNPRQIDTERYDPLHSQR